MIWRVTKVKEEREGDDESHEREEESNDFKDFCISFTDIRRVLGIWFNWYEDQEENTDDGEDQGYGDKRNIDEANKVHGMTNQ